jgi:GNAT superfamily N-acetyltransferase
MSIAIRHATGADAALVLGGVVAGFETYRSFAPPDWEPPATGPDAALATERLLDRPEVWYVLAEDDRGLAGQCGFHPAHELRQMQGAPIEGAAWLWHLFVRPDLWGSGLAGELHDMALTAMRMRGYWEARLSTPEGQMRSRGFYEKHGWREAPRSVSDAGTLTGLPLQEYRIVLAE